MLPARSLTHIAAVTLPDEVMQRPTLDRAARHYVERIFTQVGRRFDLRLCLKGVNSSNLISDIGLFEDLDFSTAEPVPPEATHRIELTISRPTRLDGLLVWLHLIVGPGQELDILDDRYCWLPVFLPAFGLGVEVPAGTQIVGTVERTLCENGRNPDYHISGELCLPDGQKQRFAYTAQQFGTSYQATPFYERALATTAPPADAQSPENFAAQLRLRLQSRLPEYMIPSVFVSLPQLPLTPVGKVDRKALPAPSATRPELRPALAAAPVAAAPPTSTQEALAALWGEVLGLAQVGLDERFFELGGHSLLLARLRRLIEQQLGFDLDMVVLFQYPTVRTLAQYVDSGIVPRVVTPAARPVPPTPVPAPPPVRAAAEAHTAEPIAIIGMAGRFPGADNLSELWQLLAAGKSGITRFTAEQLAAAGVPSDLRESADYIPAHGMLKDPLGFDAALLGVSPQDARLMDPQQRLFLECAWEALEHAGYDSARYPGGIGVFGGASIPRYWLERLAALSLRPGTAEQFRVTLGNSRDFLTTRVSFKLGLRGPSVNVQTACSTSLTAVHLACQSLSSGQCELALAGGVSLAALEAGGYVYEAGGILSPDGQCRPFDERAGGTVPGSGAALVVLKPLAAAVADGDTIYAVIRGSAMNNDGMMKVGYTAPSQEGQAAVIAQAHRAAGITPDTISYVEAHGTATALGDVIEVSALTQAFGAASRRPESCVLGSVKGNLGHLDAAAGVTGLIKTVLALHHELIPPTAHFQRANPSLKLTNSPFVVSGVARPWPRGQAPRRAGVSSFGLGGTNVHLVVQESPAAPVSEPGRKVQLLTISARSPAALESASRRLAAHLGAYPEQPLADVAFTLQQGRAALAYRRAVVCTEPKQAIAALVGSDSAPRRERCPAGRAQDRLHVSRRRQPAAGDGTVLIRTGADISAGHRPLRRAPGCRAAV